MSYRSKPLTVECVVEAAFKAGESRKHPNGIDDDHDLTDQIIEDNGIDAVLLAEDLSGLAALATFLKGAGVDSATYYIKGDFIYIRRGNIQRSLYNSDVEKGRVRK